MITRAKINIRGAVQGVGFRPFVYQLAVSMNLKGYVLNSAQGVVIEVEGDKELINKFISKLETDKPVHSFVSGMKFTFLDFTGYNSFEIKESKNSDGKKSAIILPDIAVCDDCLNEMNDPDNRRYRYPFINCTNCGPRYTITENLPYDRPNTSMQNFPMCKKCRKEYENPMDRRFHAQPIACPKCGPHIELWNNKKELISKKEEALSSVIKKIQEGKIIALKGLGGFQLIVDARNENAVKILRNRKQREEKPFALMVPSIETVKEICDFSCIEKRVLQSPQAPIVLLKKKKHKITVAESVAPGNPYLGVMLPYTPLHHLILNGLDFPVVATSGNISEEPMCIDEEEAFEKLRKIADYFLIHNRPIVRQVDDSVVRVIQDKIMMIRRARGYAPFPITLPEKYDDNTILAVGGHLKNTISLKIGKSVFISQYIGDLTSEKAYNVFIRTIKDLTTVYDAKPNEVLHDAHPDYLSTKYVKSNFRNYKSIQHHYAHVAACMVENQITDETLGVSWDGTGYGFDKTIWGGEFFISDTKAYNHVATFLQFPLPGGEKAVKEARRSALGVLFKMFGHELFENGLITNNHLPFNNKELNIIETILKKNINSPLTSSVGRLFDAVSSLLGISHFSSYEGQSAMKLEYAADKSERRYYDFNIIQTDKVIIDWRTVIEQILKEKNNGVSVSVISSKFHNTLAQIVLEMAELFETEKIALGGGCFQNFYLTNRIIELLENKNHKVYLNQRIPINDGGISFGQIAAVNSKPVKRNNTFMKNLVTDY